MTLLRVIVASLQALKQPGPQSATHLATAKRGEREAYLFLREHGYCVVERNLRERGHHGEIDLVAWDERVLCFVEVKTRVGEGLTPPEAAVDEAKKKHLRAVARRYVRRMTMTATPAMRFDIVSVTYREDDSKPDVKLIKNAFGWKNRYWSGWSDRP